MSGAKTLLDYGAGKGEQYRVRPFIDADGAEYPDLAAWWGVQVRCFDPGYVPFSVPPEGEFDAVISTDMLEHCPEEDLPWIIAELFSRARRFVFASVACFPAKKHLPNGQNAHCTVKPPRWWRPIIEAAAAKKPGLLHEFRFAVVVRGAQGESLVEEIFSGAAPVVS